MDTAMDANLSNRECALAHRVRTARERYTRKSIEAYQAYLDGGSALDEARRPPNGANGRHS